MSSARFSQNLVEGVLDGDTQAVAQNLQHVVAYFGMPEEINTLIKVDNALVCIFVFVLEMHLSVFV